MSLINDALRRAKQAQQSATPLPSHDTQHFRPVDSASQAARHGVGLLLPALLAAMALLALLLFWELSYTNSATASVRAKAALPVAARTPSASDARSGADEPASNVPPATAPAEASKSQPGPVAEPSVSSAGSSNTVSSPAVSAQNETNRALVTEPAVPAPAPLKLQSIVYNPRRPSAMINGRVVFLGDRLREYRITAIRKDEVVLAGAGQTNVLSLEP